MRLPLFGIFFVQKGGDFAENKLNLIQILGKFARKLIELCLKIEQINQGPGFNWTIVPQILL